VQEDVENVTNILKSQQEEFAISQSNNQQSMHMQNQPGTSPDTGFPPGFAPPTINVNIHHDNSHCISENLNTDRDHSKSFTIREEKTVGKVQSPTAKTDDGIISSLHAQIEYLKSQIDLRDRLAVETRKYLSN
jgi:hypothetical protein